MVRESIVEGEWYVFKLGEVVYCGHCVARGVHKCEMSILRADGGWTSTLVLYANIIKRADINSQAKKDFVDFLLDLKDFDELQKIFPKP